MSVENRLSVLHKRAVAAYGDSNKHKWVACAVARRIVGRYEEGATLSLATDLALSLSQVQNLAKAGQAYADLRKGRPEVRGYRQRLTPSHFKVIGESMRKYDMTTADAVATLQVAADEGSSVATMSKYIEGEYGGGEAEWVRNLRTMAKAANRLASDYGVPDPIRLIAESVVQGISGLWSDQTSDDT